MGLRDDIGATVGRGRCRYAGDTGKRGVDARGYIVRLAYREFEERVGDVRAPRGSKSARILAAIAGTRGTFSVADLQQQCPGTGIDLIRKVLKREREQGRISCTGRGPAARWQRTPE